MLSIMLSMHMIQLHSLYVSAIARKQDPAMKQNLSEIFLEFASDFTDDLGKSHKQSKVSNKDIDDKVASKSVI